MSVILGVNCLSHDAAVALVKDEEVLFAAHSERYTRRKNDQLLCEALLEDALTYGPAPEEIVYYERPLAKKARQLAAGQYREAMTSSPRSYLQSFARLRGLEVRYVDHHLSHAAGGYFTSGFRDATIVVIDAIGEWSTLTVWDARDRRLSKIFELTYPDSVGLFYSAFTQRVGFKPNEEEYIMMGMAALGEPEYADLIREDFLREAAPPQFILKRSMHRGIQDWRPELKRVENIAASAQKVLEDYLKDLFQWVARKCSSRNLVYSGGVALNCVANEQLARQGLFDNIWIMPNPGDAGSSLGAALAHRNEWIEWRCPYLGHDIRRPLDQQAALDALMGGEIIGVANGRAEFGPRALGNRSLLADPRPADMKDKVNEVKRREPFRPFAPLILEEHAHTYFDLPVKASPYMQFTARCKQPERYPAICHVDGSSRVQTVSRTQHPLLYGLVERFH
ncbi:MAG: carbamoyltransferase N-terminal domain-containing protein, partial [Cystobacter sp.]